MVLIIVLISTRTVWQYLKLIPEALKNYDFDYKISYKLIVDYKNKNDKNAFTKTLIIINQFKNWKKTFSRVFKLAFQ